MLPTRINPPLFSQEHIVHKLITALLLTFSGSTLADNYQCTYPGYGDGKPVVINIEIMGAKATVAGGTIVSHYQVLENNDLGVVMVYAISQTGLSSPGQHDIGLFGIAIDKTKMKLIRATVIHNSAPGAISSKSGPCTRVAS